MPRMNDYRVLETDLEDDAAEVRRLFARDGAIDDEEAAVLARLAADAQRCDTLRGRIESVTTYALFGDTPKTRRKFRDNGLAPLVLCDVPDDPAPQAA